MPTPITELTRIELYTKADTYEELIGVIDQRLEVKAYNNEPKTTSDELRHIRGMLVDLELECRREARRQEAVQKPL